LSQEVVVFLADQYCFIGVAAPAWTALAAGLVAANSPPTAGHTSRRRATPIPKMSIWRWAPFSDPDGDEHVATDWRSAPATV
jgi:hypothetical protein